SRSFVFKSTSEKTKISFVSSIGINFFFPSLSIKNNVLSLRLNVPLCVIYNVFFIMIHQPNNTHGMHIYCKILFFLVEVVLAFSLIFLYLLSLHLTFFDYCL